MHVNYCTVFDSNYMDKGLAMYNSLNRVSVDYTLFIFAFDNEAYKLLCEKNLPNIRVLQESDLLDEQSRKARDNRTRAEWCWTCSSRSLDFLLNEYNLDNCVYIDSDLYFFSDPNIIVQELIDKNKSVLITAHRFAPYLENRIIAHMYGTYCVQFNVFINNPDAREVLSWWKEQCLQDCSGNKSYEVYGDQKYLDEFPKRFKCVHVMENQGGGLAPWNISQYRMDDASEELSIINKMTGKKDRAVFYHFQGFEILDGDLINLSVYRWKGKTIDERLVKVIYRSYYAELQKVRDELKDLKESLEKQSENVRKVKEQRRKDSSVKRRIGQVIVGVLSWFRMRLAHRKDYIHISLWD